MAKKNIRWLLVVAVAAATLFFLLETEFLPGPSPQSSTAESLRLLEGVMRLVEQDYVEEPDPSKTMAGAFRGLVESLDVLSSYLDPDGVHRYRIRDRADLAETGLVLYKQFGSFPVVIGVKENSPAAAAGFRPGDPVYAVNDLSTLELSMLEVNLLLKEEDPAPVLIKTSRNAKNQVVELERALLHSAPYSFSPESGLAGVLRVHLFHPPLVDTLKKELIPLLKRNTPPLVVDLRDCYEGTLQEAARFCNLFVQAGTIGFLDGKGGVREPLACPEPVDLEGISLVIWTNPATMGPAELAARVLRDEKGASIIGRETPGLAAAQRFFPLDDGSGLVLTTSLFRPAAGEELWSKGLTPDIKIEGGSMESAPYFEATRKLIASR